jgi:hypothetical protein
MQRNCDYCGKPYEAKRKSSKYCSDTCRVKTSQHGGNVVTLPPAGEERSADPTGLVASITAELEQGGRLNTALGQQAVFLASRLAISPFDTSLASMSRELREVMARALEGVAVADDPLDELKRRRELKLAGG